jgi:hypothetical protein
MEDYKNEQWWIELEEAMKGFDEDSMSKMSDGKILLWNTAKENGQRNKISGHMSELGKKNGKKNASHPNSIAAAKIQAKKNVENKFWENLTFEQRSMGGKVSGKKRIQMEDWKDMPSIAGKASAIKSKEKADERYRTLLNLIPTDTFVTKDMKDACNKMGYSEGFWKSMLKNKKYVIQIHKGENQFNPSIYKKVI